MNESYEKIYTEIKKLFELKHAEEETIKNQLDNEVTKIKEKLEEYLSFSNNLIRN